MWDKTFRYGDIDIGLVILDIDTGCGLSIWEMIVLSILSSRISIWDILSLCPYPVNVVHAPPLFAISHTPVAPSSPGGISFLATQYA
jgi:hypothetical protein